MNDTYNARAKAFGFKPAPIGKRIGVSIEYLARSVEIVMAFGILLGQSIWRKVEKTQTNEADKMLVEVGFDALCREKYELCHSILKYAIENLDPSNDRHRRMMVVNAAIALRLTEDVVGSSALLDGEDWTSVSSDFSICVAAVRGDVDGVLKLMVPESRDGDLGYDEFTQWPAFKIVANDPRFRDRFKELFEEDFDQHEYFRPGFVGAFEALGPQKFSLRRSRKSVDDTTDSGDDAAS